MLQAQIALRSFATPLEARTDFGTTFDMVQKTLI
jgi:hypothetical protein